MGRWSLFSSAQFGHKTRRKTHSVPHSEHSRKRLAPSPSGRNTANWGLDPQKGHSGGETTVPERVPSARHSAKPGGPDPGNKSSSPRAVKHLTPSIPQTPAKDTDPPL